MTPRRRVARTIASIGIGIAALTGLYFVVQPAAVEMCVTSYENGSQSGDSMTVCNTPANLKVPNLTTYTQGLHNGCQRTINTSPNWSDCISSARVSAMPGSQKVVWYQDINYGNALACVDNNGTTNVDLTGSPNDLISSFRVLGGNCP